MKTIDSAGRTRHVAGTPRGGEFAAVDRDESEASLAGVTAGTTKDVTTAYCLAASRFADAQAVIDKLEAQHQHPDNHEIRARNGALGQVLDEFNKIKVTPPYPMVPWGFGEVAQKRGGDTVTCLCGNGGSDYAFARADREGRLAADDVEAELSVCLSCGRIYDDTHLDAAQFAHSPVLGRVNTAAREFVEAFSDYSARRFGEPGLGWDELILARVSIALEGREPSRELVQDTLAALILDVEHRELDIDPSDLWAARYAARSKTAELDTLRQHVRALAGVRVGVQRRR